MGRPRKFKSVNALADAWEEYKAYCDNQTVLTHDFSSKNSEFVSAELKRSITYTIEGFCVFAGISRAAFYERYTENEKFADIVTRMREECEIDARKKFELQMVPSQLAGLWMSKYGYTTKTESSVSGGVPVQIVDDLDG
ncbi:DNA-packaging protein gp3 [anaerobic digester metagenome]